MRAAFAVVAQTCAAFHMPPRSCTVPVESPECGGSFCPDGDGTGHRVAKSGGGATTIYVYDAAGQLAEEYAPGSAWKKDYVRLGSQLIAEEYDGTVSTSMPCTTCYFTYDHLGTVRLITDQNANVISRHDYLPFGEEIPANAAGRNGQFGPANDSVAQKFTAKERDSESGLDYFGARYYGSGLGRFTSADPKVRSAHINDPQTWNRYTYVTNRPYTYVDPDGLEKMLVVYVEQPKPGTRETHVGTNFGHAFIGIRDTDLKTEVKVGFYPDGPLGTSLRVANGETVRGGIKNNDQHSYNVENDFTISDKQYQRLIDSVKQDANQPPDYTLKTFNCTDWVIKESKVAGVNLPTQSRGEDHPNTPADLGQDLAGQSGTKTTGHMGPDQGSSDHEDPQRTNNLTPLWKLKPPSGNQN
jgi:RHS repeat-associated protein